MSRDHEIRDNELRQQAQHKRMDLAYNIVHLAATRRAMIEGDEWKGGECVDKKLVEAAVKRLTMFLSPD